MSEIPTSNPDFLPQGFHTWDQLREAVLNNLDATLDLIPQLPLDEVGLEDLEYLEPGAYLLDGRPSLNLLYRLPDFAAGSREVGIFCIQGRWIIVLGSDLEIFLPQTLASIEGQRLFQLDMHTHPGMDPGVDQPSDKDIHKLTSTIDGCNYIINYKGLLEFHLPDVMPGGFTDPLDVHQAWRYWVVEDLKLSQEEYESIGGWELKRQFFEQYFGLRQIWWEETDKLVAILNKDAK